MLECELKNQAKQREAETRFDTLMIAFKLMEDKNASLQESLSAETRFKLDLFSALGETRRQLEAVNFQLESKERELNAFKSIFKQSFGVANTSDTTQNDLISQYLANQLNSLQTHNGAVSMTTQQAANSNGGSPANTPTHMASNLMNGLLMNSSMGHNHQHHHSLGQIHHNSNTNINNNNNNNNNNSSSNNNGNVSMIQMKNSSGSTGSV